MPPNTRPASDPIPTNAAMPAASPAPNPFEISNGTTMTVSAMAPVPKMKKASASLQNIAERKPSRAVRPGSSLAAACPFARLRSFALRKNSSTSGSTASAAPAPSAA